MANPSDISRRRWLRISACAVAASSIGETLASTRQRAQLTTGDQVTDAARPVAKGLSAGSVVDSSTTHHFTAHAMGAGVSLAIVHSDHEAAKKLASLAFAEISRLERIFSLYLEDSLVVRLNREGKLELPPAELLTVFSQVSGIWRATNGAFDPTVQPYWNRRHDTAVEDATFSWRDVEYSSSRIAFKRPGMAVTLNGIAQGYVSEKIAQLLRGEGLGNILVNVGEIVVVGKRADGEPWQVGLAELQSGVAQQKLALTDTAIATSAPLSGFDDTQVAAGHIIDPATGRSCDSPWQRLSVIHPSAAIADGLSTGLVQKSGTGIRLAISRYPQARVLALDARAGLQTFST